jgi:diaminopimelate epimerase
MIRFEKYHGTGNDFIFVYDQPANPTECAIRLCDRHFGIGADGLMFAQSSAIADIKMRYYNSDGSHATMCGNGLRCFVRFVTNNNLVNKTEFVVETDAGLIPVKIDDHVIQLRLNRERTELTQNESRLPMVDYTPIELEHTLIYGVFIGTLHGVVFVENFDHIEELGPALTNHPNFPQSININFVRVLDRNRMEVRTHERGAGWTLSCGTGVCASVIVAHALNKVNNNVIIDVLGGQLNVRCEVDGIYLSGPAQWIARGETE